MSIFNIDKSIKNQFIPYSISNRPKSAEELSGLSKDQKEELTNFYGVYTFKPGNNTNVADGLESIADTLYHRNIALLNICPTSIKNAYNEDLANKLLQINATSSENENTQITFNSLLRYIPSIQIREFLPDSRIDQIFGIFSGSSDTNLSGTETKIFDIAKNVFQKISDKNFWSNALSSITNISFKNEQDATNTTDSTQLQKISTPFSESANNYTSILSFPFNIYTRLQKAKTTNMYEVPVINYKQAIYQSDGTPGWDAGELNLNTLFDKIGGGILGSALKGLTNTFSKTLGSQIGITMVKWWDGSTGYKTTEPEVTIEFDLFNDREESTIYNYIFIQQLIANNKWVQYHILKHSPNLYDIKFPWLNKRLFMCRGKFEVTAKGVMRRFDSHGKNEKLQKYMNKSYDANGFSMTNNAIYIPDVYHVKMTFSSLLPDNFNTYLFGFTHNNSITNVQLYDNQSIFTSLIDGIKNIFIADDQAKMDEILKEIEQKKIKNKNDTEKQNESANA